MFPSSDPAIPQAKSEDFEAESRTAKDNPWHSGDEAYSVVRLAGVQQRPGQKFMPSEWLERELDERSEEYLHPSNDRAGYINSRGEPSHQAGRRSYLQMGESARQVERPSGEDRFGASPLHLSAPSYDHYRPASAEPRQDAVAEPANTAHQAYNAHSYNPHQHERFQLSHSDRQTKRSDIDSLFESSDVEGDSSLLQQPSETARHRPPIPGLFDRDHDGPASIPQRTLSRDRQAETSFRRQQDSGSGEEEHYQAQDVGWHTPERLSMGYGHFGSINDASAGKEPLGPPGSLRLPPFDTAFAELARREPQEEHHVSAYQNNGHDSNRDAEIGSQTRFHWLSCGCPVGQCHCPGDSSESSVSNETDNLDRPPSHNGDRTNLKSLGSMDHTSSQRSTQVAMSSMAGYRETTVPPSRPDTPRPPVDPTEIPSFGRGILDDSLRQSVESELPPAGWAPAGSRCVDPSPYGARSSTPSPISARGGYSEISSWAHQPGMRPMDREASAPPPERQMSIPPRDRKMSMPPPEKEMTVSPSEREMSRPSGQREMSVPPAGVEMSVSPAGMETFLSSTDVEISVAAHEANGMETASTEQFQRPNVPPIPDNIGPLKQPKRGERRKSAVQGAKVEKRSVTGTTKPKPKSRNVTRKPTASVGKLVEQAKKINKATDGADEDHEMDGNKPKVAGKVAAAVNKIEKQVKQQAEEKNLKQKDGNPVRRSQRVKQAARTSMP